MCDYSMHALATRPAKVGETLITTTFPGTSTRGFASVSDPHVAVCMLPGTELAFAENVRYDNRWIWTERSVSASANSARSTAMCRTVTMTRSNFRTAAACS